MNVFETIMADQTKAEMSLGNPLRDPDAIERRMNNFATMTGGKGFRTPAKTPKVRKNGMTRGEIKRKSYNRAFGIE